MKLRKLRSLPEPVSAGRRAVPYVLEADLAKRGAGDEEEVPLPLPLLPVVEIDKSSAWQEH